jgi:hypothetical protein
MATPTLRRLAAPAAVRPETLNVAPALLGVPLATPARRAAAIAIDFGVLALLSASGAFWLAAGTAATVFQLRRRQPAQGLRRNLWLWLALAVLVFLGAQQAADLAGRWVGAHAPADVAARAGNDDEDDDPLARPDAVATPEIPATSATPAIGATGASAAAAAAAASGTAPLPSQAVLAARVARLEAELAEAHKPAAQRWRDEALRRLHRLGVGFGWAAFYFTLLPFAWQGRTVGKRLLGLRIVELTGRPLTVLGCFGRYGGYAAAMATGGVGFLQILWDSNRQAIQDKIAHTVVVDERRASAAAPQATPVALEAAREEP